VPPIIEPFQRLRVILLERVAQPVGQPGLVANQLPAPLSRAHQRPHRGALWPQGAEPLWMVQQEVEPEFRIARIVLGATGLERFTLFKERLHWETSRDRGEHAHMIQTDRRRNGR
jgi:hypothetical protein